MKIGSSLKKKPIILLVRNPRDVVVSLFYELSQRHNFYEGEMSQFIREPYTLKKIIAYMNMWYSDMEHRRHDYLLLRYEDLMDDTFAQMERVVHFLAIDANKQVLSKAIDYGSFGNMKAMEISDAFGDTRLSARNLDNPNTYKVRKGKVDGYKKDLSIADIDYMDQIIARELQKGYGY